MECERERGSERHTGRDTHTRTQNLPACVMTTRQPDMAPCGAARPLVPRTRALPGGRGVTAHTGRGEARAAASVHSVVRVQARGPRCVERAVGCTNVDVDAGASSGHIDILFL